MSKFRIRFQGEEYLLIGDIESGGGITTEKAFKRFKENLVLSNTIRLGEESYAHLYPTGRILRFGKQIGNRDDIEIIEEV